LEDCNVSGIYKKVLKGKKDLSMKDMIIQTVLECDDITNLDLLPFVNEILKSKKQNTSKFLTLRELGILNFINSESDCTDFD